MTLLRTTSLCLLTLAAAGLSPALALTDPIPKGAVTIKLQTLANISPTGIGTPQDLTFAPDGSNRLFIAHRNGTINMLNNQTGALVGAPFLNLATAPGVSLFTGGEGGFLGLAFAPDYTTSRKFYTYTTENFSSSGPAADYSPPEMFPTTNISPSNQIVIREWTASNNPNVANTASRELLRINHPQNNHQGGAIRFGPDGNLYLAIGDGGGQNDFQNSAGNNSDGHNNLIGNAQDLTSPLGKILRINPNPAAGAGFTVSTNGDYSIPNSNAFIAGANGALKEVYAYGLRNPFKITFDTANGTLYAADVGQGQREEINVIVNGGNYGWVFREGTRDNTAGSGRGLPDPFTPLAPFAEYTHADGLAVIGGEVYRGGLFPALEGKYVFGDLNRTFPDPGRLFYTDPANGNIFEFNYDPSGITPPADLYGVHAGPAGELYALFSNGTIARITPIPEPTTALLLGIAATGLLLRRRRV